MLTRAAGRGDNGLMTSAPVEDQGPRRAILGKLPRMYRADGSAIRVLLVDDERALTNLVKMALAYEGGRSMSPTMPPKPSRSTARTP